MEEYLPPIVTKLKADLSDLVTGLATARELVRDFAAGAHKDMVDAFGDAGRDGGALFANEFRKNAKNLLNPLEEELGKKFRKTGEDAGRGFLLSFFGSISSLVTSNPLVALIIASLPILGPLLAGAIAIAFSGIFIGVGAFLLRQQPALIAAAANFKNTVGAVFKDAALPMLGPLVKSLDYLSNLVKVLGPDFKEMFASVAQVIEPLTRGLGDLITNMLPGLKEMFAHPEIVIAFAQGLGGVGAGLGEIFHQIAIHGPEIARFMTDFMIALANVLRWLGLFIGYLTVTYDALHKGAVKAGLGIAAAFEWVKNAIKATGDWITNTAGSIGDWFTRAWNAVINFFTSTGDAIGGFFGKVGDTIGGWVDKTVAWFKALPGKIWAALVALPGQLGKAAVAAFDAFFYWTAFGIAKLVQLWAATPFLIAAVLYKGWQLILQGFHAFIDQVVAAWRWVKDAFTTGVDAVVTTAQTLPGKIMAWFSELGHSLADWATGTFLPWAERTVTDFVRWWYELPGRAGKAFGEFLGKAKAWFADAGSWLWQAGKDMIGGLIKGIEAAVEAAVNVIKRAMDKIKEGARHALDSRSPSRVFAEIGRDTMRGYIQGVLGEKGALAQVWDRMQMPGISAGPMVALAGAAAGGSYGGSASAGPQMVHTTLNVDGQAFVTAITPAAQKQKARTGTTGLS